MNDKTESSEHSGENTAVESSGSTKKDWIIRGVVFIPLLVAVVFAWLDHQVKTQATETFAALKEKQDSLEKEGKELLESDVKSLIQGNPVVKDRQTPSGFERLYIFNGTFRDYAVMIQYSFGEDAVVETLIATSEAAAEIPGFEETEIRRKRGQPTGPAMKPTASNNDDDEIPLADPAALNN